MSLNCTNLLLLLLGGVLVLCFVLTLMQKQENFENNDPVMDAITQKLQTESPEQLKQTINNLQQRLIDYGYAPDMNSYVKKTELGVNSGKCTVSVAEDRDKYMSKTDVPPPGPRIDLSQYVKKSSIPPAPVCPPTPTVDLSAYVKKSTLPPNEKCPPCIAPKVKVSAGLCRECPPPPPCPAPAPCPSCNCPAPAPCPTQKECTKCSDIKYIKVPAVITKTITVDKDGKVIKQQIDSGSTTPTQNMATTTTQALTPSSASTVPNPSTPSTTSSASTLLNSLLGSSDNQQMMPSTTFPMITSCNVNLAQTLDNPVDGKIYPSAELNTPFMEYNGGRVRGRNESNFPYKS